MIIDNYFLKLTFLPAANAAINDAAPQDVGV
jgi:hypothetical protein